MEEASRIPWELFVETIMPLMSVSKRCMLAISTPLESGNFYSELFNIKDERGNALFETFRMKMVCDECEKKDSNAFQCPHMLHTLPAYKSIRSHMRVSDIMGKIAPEYRSTEIMGKERENNKPAFKAELITSIRDKPRFVMPPSRFPTMAFIAIDPSGGGAHSDLAIMSGYIFDGRYVITGIDSEPIVTATEARRVIVTHAKLLRYMPEVCTSPNIIFTSLIEANMGWDKSSEMSCYLNQIPAAWRHYRDTSKSDGRFIGFSTTEHTKSAMVTSMSTALISGSVVFHSDLFSAGSKEPQVLFNDLMVQMSGFRRALRIPKERIHQAARVSYSGKEGGRKDDLAMVFMMFVHYSHISSMRYATMAN